MSYEQNNECFVNRLTRREIPPLVGISLAASLSVSICVPTLARFSRNPVWYSCTIAFYSFGFLWASALCFYVILFFYTWGAHALKSRTSPLLLFHSNAVNKWSGSCISLKEWQSGTNIMEIKESHCSIIGIEVTENTPSQSDRERTCFKVIM